ncbi:MAG: HAMP domain-containing sensor histidine kinase [Bacillota bacterium]|nr:HAMP domain-containing sensor histidine kinase [Bacillota bacterium]
MLIVCTIVAVTLSALFVNIAMNTTFNKYMTDVQKQRNERIVQYFTDIYKKNGKWSSNSGDELIHEAYMSNYCLTLLDENKNMVWGMNPKDINNNSYTHTMMGEAGKGVYTTKTFNINLDGKTVGYVIVGQYYAVLLSEQDINFKNSINKGIAVSTILTVLIVTGISLVISKQFSRPIKEVSDISAQLSKGDLEVRSNIKSNIIEINSLIKSINMLGEKLKGQDLLRKRLISDISHEIRTPLNILQNNLEAMIDGILPVTIDRLNSLDEEVIRFGKLLNNLNSLKQFDTEEVKLNMVSVSLKELLSQVCEDFYTLAKEKNINIYFKAEENEFTILGDIDKLKQVFINLISNSIKFSKQNGNVWVNLKQRDDKVMIEIRDDGIGIKKEDLPYIFERLYRGDKSRQMISGNGIGLTIAKKILDLHLASIEVDSEENKGTIFTVCFP